MAGGFGSAVLEAAAEAGLDTSHVRRLGIPDRFIEHGERGELLADLGLDSRSASRSSAASMRNDFESPIVPVGVKSLNQGLLAELRWGNTDGAPLVLRG